MIDYMIGPNCGYSAPDCLGKQNGMNNYDTDFICFKVILFQGLLMTLYVRVLTFLCPYTVLGSLIDQR